MKGKVKIELFEGGKKVKEVEHSNTFQSSVVQKWFETMGANEKSPYSFTDRGTVEPWKHLVGGLLLLDDTNNLINLGDLCVPDGVAMTGNGAYNVNNSSTPNELGSYNSAEEVVGASAITMVWDYTTAQANGKITTVALTTDWGGYIGYGNKSGRASQIDFVRNQDNALEQCALPVGYVGYGSNGKMYGFDTSGTTLKLFERDPSFDSYDLINSTPSIAANEYTETDFTINAIPSSPWAVGFVGGQYLVIVGANNVAPNGTFNAIIVDCLAKTIVEQTITNTTGLTIQVKGWSGAWAAMNAIGIIDEDTLLVHAQDGADIKSFLIDISTSVATSIGVITDGATLAGMSNNAQGRCFSVPLPGGKTIIGNTIFDRTEGSLKQINGCSSINGYNLAACYNDRMLTNDTSYINRTRMIHNPMMLHTIAVLDTPVTKANTQSMKVTYTLTRS